jgi:hypothetical protein
MRAIGLVAALALAACGQESVPAETPTPTASVASGTYAPRDECGKLPGADAFRAQLAAAVKARDAQAVARLAAEEVKLDFGEGAGRTELIARLVDPDTELWTALDELTALGCAASGEGEFTLPWYFAQDIPIDPYDGMIVTGDNVPLLQSAEAGAQTVATLHWDAIELVAGLYPEKPFQQVKFGDKQGYVATDKLRSLIDYRLIASNRGGAWHIDAFIAGD